VILLAVSNSKFQANEVVSTISTRVSLCCVERPKLVSIAAGTDFQWEAQVGTNGPG
jgi:hypothetical protein